MNAAQQSIALVTGSTDGVGRPVAEQLGKLGYRVLVHGRNPERGAETVAQIQADGGTAEFLRADFASLDDVRALAAAVADRCDHLDLLVNNAGIGMMKDENAAAAEFSFADGKITNPDFRFADERKTSADGIEQFFAVNYLAPYVLTRLLLPVLKRSPSARIVNVSSNGQRDIDFDNVLLEDEYDDFRAYCQSKNALMMLTFDLAEELRGTTVTANGLHPASRMNTTMTRYSGLSEASSIEDGVRSIMNLAVSPEMEGRTGVYFRELEETRANDQAYDADARRRLRAVSAKLTGVD